jgi:hypothetical protein
MRKESGMKKRAFRVGDQVQIKPGQLTPEYIGPPRTMGVILDVDEQHDFFGYNIFVHFLGGMQVRMWIPDCAIELAEGGQ